MTRTTAAEPALVVSDVHGIYIPQIWCSDITEPDCAALQIQWSDVQTCQAGPDQEWYWEAWTAILDYCSFTDARGIVWTLHQDGDLWEVPEGFTFEEY
jgi:hypothetical protein